MSNSGDFYSKCKQYQDRRAELTANYEKKLASMERYKGSEGYKSDLSKIQKNYENDMKNLMADYRPSIMATIRAMEEAVSRRTINPPTNEQLNLLSVLKMRDKVSQNELDRVAEMVKDNGIALGVIQEVARANGIFKNYESMAEEMSSSYAHKIVEGLRGSVDDWMKYDTTRASRVIYNNNMRRYGTSGPMKRRPLFDDMAGCFEELAGMDHDSLKQFMEIIDG